MSVQVTKGSLENEFHAHIDDANVENTINVIIF